MDLVISRTRLLREPGYELSYLINASRDGLKTSRTPLLRRVRPHGLLAHRASATSAGSRAASRARLRHDRSRGELPYEVGYG